MLNVADFAALIAASEMGKAIDKAAFASAVSNAEQEQTYGLLAVAYCCAGHVLMDMSDFLHAIERAA